MKNNLFFTFLTLFIQAQGFAQQNFMDSISSGGIMRTYRVYVPTVYDGQTPRPLLINFHGNFQTAESFENITQFRNVADTANFILITPNGTVNPGIPSAGQGWNNLTCCSTVDDVLFVSDLIDTLSNQYNIDNTRIYASGFSNGGLMVYDLACKLSHRVAAVASVAGTMITTRLKSCSPSRVVPVLEIHGTLDGNVPFNGGLIIGNDTLASVTAVLGFWKGFNQCSPFPTITNLPNINTTDGSTVQQNIYPNCGDGSALELLKILSGGHSWPGWSGSNANQDIIADREIWRFFSQHNLNGSVSTAEKANSPEWDVYPNPANNVLYINTQEGTAKTSVRILDILSKPVLESQFTAPSSSQFRIELSSLPNGVYFLYLQNEDLEFPVKKFLIARQ